MRLKQVFHVALRAPHTLVLILHPLFSHWEALWADHHRHHQPGHDHTGFCGLSYFLVFPPTSEFKRVQGRWEEAGNVAGEREGE